MRVVLPQSMQSTLISCDEASCGPFRDSQSFFVKCTQSSLNGIGIGACLDREITHGGDLFARFPRTVGNTTAERIS